MTKDEYLNWLQTRGPVGTWDITKCREADQLIQETVELSCDEWLKINVTEPAKSLLATMIHAHFGSVEVDDFLQTIKAYPDWM